MLAQLLEIHAAGSNSATSSAAPDVLRHPDQLRSYLQQLVREEWIDEHMPNFALATMSWIRSLDPKLGLPDMGPTNTGRIVMTWDRNGRHLEAEVLPNGDAEIFFRDRATKHYWGEDITLNVVSAAQVKALRMAIREFLA